MSKKVAGVLKAVRHGRGGVSVSHNKNTAEMPVERMPIPSKVVLSMQQHIGAPCSPTVKVGDIVSVGQVVGDSESFVSAPIHATVSGKVTAVGDIRLANGIITKGVTIESDGEMRLYEGIKPPVVTNKKELAKAVRESGLVGLGGAGFPTHVKLNFPDDKEIDTLVINAAECEPYITVDYRECIENAENVLKGAELIRKILGIKQVIIAIEDNKPKVFEIMKEIADRDNDKGDAIKLMTLASRYPQGAEKMMVLSATGRKVPPGKLPADVGCIVINVASVAFIARYIETGKPLVSRSITVDGGAISQPKNLRVPIGTNIGDIIEYCGGFKEEPRKLISGGPMMGIAICSTDAPICKQNNAILAFDNRKDLIKKERDCIRCGKCVDVCPMSLMPTLIERYAKIKDAESLKAYSVNVCMECGSCAYCCPSGRPLVQYMRLAKQVLREESAK
ncbi:MAG: electron transport complex subunit RsxC [Clostridia bacterium]|nr:electron transport complex subunit RsxC [Oscillospiraceae bacterium]MBQ7005773.1 electron transport complex subunit RsxC [Clostridia bacterium]